MKTKPLYQTDVVTVTRNCSLADAAKTMRDKHVGDVVVVERGGGREKPIGILTDRDIVVEVLAAGLSPDKMDVGDIMTSDLVTADSDQTLFGFISTMRVTGVRRLPVVDSQGFLVGIICADDLLEGVGMELSGLAKVPRYQRKAEKEMRTSRG